MFLLMWEVKEYHCGMAADYPFYLRAMNTDP
jgi:hypothetical protein